MQFLDPDPVILRGYADHGRIAQMGEHGEGFAGIIKQICGSPSSYDALLEWLKNLRPDEITSLTTVEAPAGELMLAVNEYSRQFLAPTLSEGTLRFIALAAAFFQPVMPKVIVLEEIEKGLHPSRLRLLLELMRTQSKRTNTQVIATTHSPTLLSWLTSEDRKTTFVCSRDAESGATQMHSLAELPDLESILSKGSALSELFEQGWMESVL
jgi:predicted ATPase